MKHLKRIFESIDPDLVNIQDEFSHLPDETKYEIVEYPSYILIEIHLSTDPTRLGSIQSIEELNRLKDLLNRQNSNLSVLKNLLIRLQKKHGYEFFIPISRRLDYLEIKIFRRSKSSPLLDAFYSHEKRFGSKYRKFEPDESFLRAILKEKFGLELVKCGYEMAFCVLEIYGDQEQNTDLIEQFSKVVNFGYNKVTYFPETDITKLYTMSKKIE